MSSYRPFIEDPDDIVRFEGGRFVVLRKPEPPPTRIVTCVTCSESNSRVRMCWF